MKTDEKLEALAAYHEQMAAGIRMTITALTGEDMKRARATMNGKIAGALKLRKKLHVGAAINQNGSHKQKGKGGSYALATVLKDAGKKLNREELREGLRKIGGLDAMRAVGAALRYGYIKKSGTGKHMVFEFKTMPEAPAGA